jgi:hypothetical protein
MLCAKCGNDNPADASFCEACGANLDLVCPTCKTSASPGARFCKKCGTAFAATRSDSHPARPSEPPIRVAADAGFAPGAIDGERQDGDGVVRGLEGLDRADGGNGSRRGARDYRPGAAHHDRRGQALRRQPRRRPSHATLNTLRAPCIRLAARPRPQLKRPRNISLHSLPNTGVYPLVGSGDERSRSGDGRAGRKEEGIAQMREGLAALQAPTPRRQYLSLLAKA